MKALLLTVSLGLVAALRDQDPLDPNKTLNILGTWYMKNIVVDKELLGGKVLGPVSPVRLASLNGSDLKAFFTHLRNGQCREMETTLYSMGVPGRYSAFGGTSHLQIEELPMKDHCIFHCEGEFQGQRFRIGELMGRNLDLNLEALEEFKKFTQRKGLLLKNIFSPVQMENCTRSHG